MMIPLLKTLACVQNNLHQIFSFIFLENPTGIVDLIIIGVFILKSKADFIDSSTVKYQKN